MIKINRNTLVFIVEYRNKIIKTILTVKYIYFLHYRFLNLTQPQHLLFKQCKLVFYL